MRSSNHLQVEIETMERRVAGQDVNLAYLKKTRDALMEKYEDELEYYRKEIEKAEERLRNTKQSLEELMHQKDVAPIWQFEHRQVWMSAEEEKTPTHLYRPRSWASSPPGKADYFIMAQLRAEGWRWWIRSEAMGMNVCSSGVFLRDIDHGQMKKTLQRLYETMASGSRSA